MNEYVEDYTPEKANIANFVDKILIIHEVEFDNVGLGFVKLHTDMGLVTTASRVIAKQAQALSLRKKLPVRVLIRRATTVNGEYYYFDSPKGVRNS